MIAAYVRVSTKDQNPDLQRVEIGAWAKANGIEEVIWYEDRISGDKSSRPFSMRSGRIFSQGR